MTELAHSVRNSMVDRERLYRLGPDALLWSERGKDGALPYAQIRRMQLISYAGGGGTIFQCALRSAGGKTLIRSHHFAGLGNFEDRRATYAPFVRELARRIADSAPQARFIAGSTVLRIVWILLGALMVLMALLLALILVDGSGTGTSIATALVVLGLAGPLAWREARKGNARGFDPRDPPAELLG